MSLDLPQPIDAYFRASNQHNTNALLVSFADDATVADEGHEHHGLEEIKQWSDEVIEKYRVTTEPKSVVQEGDGIVITAQVSGTFDGSPIKLYFRFTLNGDKIAALQIQ